MSIDGFSEQKVGDILWNVLLQLDVVYIKMEKGRVCLCTNTPGDSNNNAAVLGSHRAARAVRPFVSRGHSLHYNPKDKVPSGGTESHEGSGIVPHSMHTSVFSQTCYTLFRDEQSFKKGLMLTIRRCRQTAVLTWCGVERRRKEEEEIEEEKKKGGGGD